MERHRLREDLRPDELVERVVPADVLAQREELARRREQARRVEAAGLVERPLGGAEQVRQGEDHARGRRPGRPGSGSDADGDLVERGLAADPARRRRDEVPLRRRRDASNGRARRTVIWSSGWFIAAGSPVVDPEDLRAVDQALGPQEARPRARPRSPGVRIVTATATGSWPGPAARISSGSSPTTRSPRNSSDAPRTATIRVVVTWRVGGGVASRHCVSARARTTPTPSYAVIFVEAVASGHHAANQPEPAERRDDRPVVGERDDDARDAGPGSADDGRHRVGAVAARTTSRRARWRPGQLLERESPDVEPAAHSVVASTGRRSISTKQSDSVVLVRADEEDVRSAAGVDGDERQGRRGLELWRSPCPCTPPARASGTAWSTANGSACHGSWMLCGGSIDRRPRPRRRRSRPSRRRRVRARVRNVTGQGCIIDRWRRRT